MIEKIEADLKTAMLERDQFRVSVLRSLLNSIKTTAKDQKTELSKAEIIKVLQKEAKQRDEASVAFTKGGAEDRAQAEQAERKIIEEYLPEPMSDDELDALVEAAIEVHGADSKNMGQIISEVVKQADGKADGSRVAAKVRGRLQ